MISPTAHKNTLEARQDHPRFRQGTPRFKEVHRVTCPRSHSGRTETRTHFFRLQSPMLRSPSQVLKPSGSELNTTAYWWPLPRIADMSPKSPEMRSSTPALWGSGPSPIHLWRRGNQAGSKGTGALGPEGGSQGQPREDSEDKGSPMTASGRGGARRPGRMPASRGYKKIGLKCFSLYNPCLHTHTEVQVQSDKPSRCHWRVNGGKGKREGNGREHLMKKRRQVSNAGRPGAEV